MGLSQPWYDANKAELDLAINPLDANGEGTGKKDIVNLLTDLDEQLRFLKNSLTETPQVLTEFDK